MTTYTEFTVSNYLKSMSFSEDLELESTVKSIIKDVLDNKDKALLAYTLTFDKVVLKNLKVTQKDIDDAFLNTNEKVIQALEKAIKHIKIYHQKQSLPHFEYELDGRIIGQKVTPIEKVGIYIPGGTASYPSTVLMSVIPALIAGVKHIVIITPPNKKGQANQTVLAAARLLGIKDIYLVGGAQGIAALAFGTETIPKVDKIVGPGNRFVAEAKKQLSGIVGIDTIAGPSEVCILADKHANPMYVAADLLAQAEHDTYAKAICVSTSQSLLKEVEKEVYRQLEMLPRKDIASASIKQFGALIYVDTMEKAVAMVNRIAPEHLEIQVENPLTYLHQIQHAGAIFFGSYTPEPVGDYMAGPNHTLPTSGVARFSSGLSTYDFLKRTSYVSYSKEAFLEDAIDIITIATEEKLSAHAQSIKVRL